MKFKTREIAFVGMFVAFAVVAAMVSRFWGNIVPFSLLPFVSVFSGAVLGKRLGAFAILVYIIIGLIGIPVFASAPYGGISYVLVPSFGFIIGFLLAAFVCGMIVEKSNRLTHYILGAVIGLIPLYLIGLFYLWLSLNLWVGKSIDWWGVLKIGFFPFFLKDLALSIIAAILAKGIESRLPQGFIRRAS